MPMRISLLAVLTFFLVTPVASAAGETITLDLSGGVTLEAVKVEPGTFTQGSPSSEAGRGDDETPRQVHLTRPFYIGTTPVTRAQWERFVKEWGHRTEAEKGTSGGYGWDGSKLVQRKEFTWKNPGFAQTADHPVCIITYADALAFCKWLSGKTAREVTLPTEAQWEYACRAGTDSPWHNGAADADGGGEVAWNKQNAGNTTHPVTSRKSNAWGLTIGGNVSEWCRDWYGPYDAGPVTDPLQENRNVSGDKPRRVLRGGSWNRDAKHTRSAARFRADPGSRNADIGFRVVVSDRPVAPPTPAPSASNVPPPPDATPPIERSDTVAPPASTPPTNMPTPVVRGRRWSFGPFVCIAAALAIVAFIAIRVLRGLAKTSLNGGNVPRPGFASGGGAPRNVAGGGSSGEGIRIGPDGFWMLLDQISLGSRVHYGYRLPGAGEEASGSVLYQPGPEGQFIYTGAAPQYARVLRVDPPGADATWDQGASGVGTSFGDFPPPLPGMSRRGTTQSTRSSDDDDRPRYPSAY